MEKGRLITLGHGQRSLQQVNELLNGLQVIYLVDVRSRPYSKFNPGFSKQPLERFLSEQGFKYIFMGDLLGGRPQDDFVYTRGEIDYEILKTKEYFQQGIQRLITAYDKGLVLALMCAEMSPLNCHRSMLIASELVQRGIPVWHIDENDHLIEHAMIQQPNIDQLSLF